MLPVGADGGHLLKLGLLQLQHGGSDRVHGDAAHFAFCELDSPRECGVLAVCPPARDTVAGAQARPLEPFAGCLRGQAKPAKRRRDYLPQTRPVQGEGFVGPQARAHHARQKARLAMTVATARVPWSAKRKRNRRPAGLACARCSERTVNSQATTRWVLSPRKSALRRALTGDYGPTSIQSSSRREVLVRKTTMFVGSPRGYMCVYPPQYRLSSQALRSQVPEASAKTAFMSPGTSLIPPGCRAWNVEVCSMHRRRCGAGMPGGKCTLETITGALSDMCRAMLMAFSMRSF